MQDGPVVSKKDKEEQARRKELALKRLKESPRQKAKQELKGKREKNKAKKLVRTMKRQAAAGAKK